MSESSPASNNEQPKALRTSGSVAMDDYLEQILQLIEENDEDYARPVDVSRKLGISQASVTKMLKRLTAEGLVNHEKYGGTTLTEKGHTIAHAIVERHKTLTQFLRLFNIDEQTIYKDVEGIEHHVSKATLNVITSLVAELEDNPDLLERIKKRI